MKIRPFGARVGTRQARCWTVRMLAKQAVARLERFGLDVLGPGGKPDPGNRRLMRNARKLERQRARLPRNFWRGLRKYIEHKYGDERNLP